VRAFNAVLYDELVRFPADLEERRNIADRFYMYQQFPFIAGESVVQRGVP